MDRYRQIVFWCVCKWVFYANCSSDTKEYIYPVFSESVVASVGKVKTRSDALEQHIRHVCKTMRFSDTVSNKTIGSSMYYDEGRKVIYCSIPKVRRAREDSYLCTECESVPNTDIVMNDKLLEISCYHLHYHEILQYCASNPLCILNLLLFT